MSDRFCLSISLHSSEQTSSVTQSTTEPSSQSIISLYQQEYTRLQEEITLLQKEIQCVTKQRDHYRYRLFGRKDGDEQEDEILSELKVGFDE